MLNVRPNNVSGLYHLPPVACQPGTCVKTTQIDWSHAEARPGYFFVRSLCGSVQTTAEKYASPSRSRPRPDSLCALASGGPSGKLGGLAAPSRGPFTHKPGALKAGEADSRNRKAQIADAPGPRNGFLISQSSPPACHVHRQGCREAGQRVRLVLCLNYTGERN